MPALAAFIGGMAKGRLEEHAAQDKQRIEEGKIAARAKAARQGEIDKRVSSVSQVIEQISSQNPDVTPGQIHQLEVNLLNLSSKAYANVENLVYSVDPDEGYRFVNGRIMGKPKVTPIANVGDNAKTYAEAALSGAYPQFNKAMEASGFDLGDIMSSATEEQRSTWRCILGLRYNRLRIRVYPISPLL